MSNKRASSAMFFAVYIGCSMNPTLCEPEIVEIVPYDRNCLRVGDVAYFLSPETNQPIIHRIMRMTQAGISTLGDHNADWDAFLLPPENIKGRVVAAWNGQQRRRIAGGLPGAWAGGWYHRQHVFGRRIPPLLHLLYRALSYRTWMAQFLPAALRPQVVVFNARGQNQLQLLLRQHIIGRYDAQSNQWLISRPFRLLVNEKTLPRPPAGSRLDPPRLREWQRP